MKKTVITIGLISAVGIGGMFARYKLNSFTNTNTYANSYGDAQSSGINNNNAGSNKN